MKVTVTLNLDETDQLDIGRRMLGTQYGEVKANRAQCKAFLENQGPVIVGELLKRDSGEEA